MANSPIHVATEMVTPDRAKGWLANIQNDRPVSRNTVSNYTEVMRRGLWKFNGDPIRLNEEGKLIDGQHRLQAIINSGKAQKMLVINGLNDDVFDTIDVGKKRSASDLLTISGYTHATGLAATVRALLIYESGVYWASETAKNLDYNPTGAQVVAYANEYPEVFECVKAIYNDYTFVLRVCPPSAIGLAYTLAWRQNRTKAEAFLAGVAGEESTERNDPRWVAREYLARQKLESATRRITSHQAQAVMVKAANFFFGGLTATSATLRFMPEKHWFPRFDGGKKDSKEALKREKEKA